MPAYGQSKVKEHTLEHTYHWQISGQILSAFLLTSLKDGYALPNLIQAQQVRLFASSIVFLDLVEVTHCISAGEHKHCCQLHCNCITDIIMNLRYIQKLVFLHLLKPVMIGKTKCQYMHHTYQNISIRCNHHCWFILQWTMIHNVSLRFFVIRWI